MPHAIDTFKLKEHLKLEMEYGTTVPEKPSKHLKLEMEYGTPVPENHLNIFYSEIFDIMVLRWLFHIMIFTCDSHCTDLAASQIAKLGNVYMRQKTPRSNRMLFPIWNLKVLHIQEVEDSEGISNGNQIKCHFPCGSSSFHVRNGEWNACFFPIWRMLHWLIKWLTSVSKCIHL